MSIAQRQAFSTIRRAYAKVGRKPVTTPSTLRLIQNVVANRTTYTFPILEGDSNITLPEQRLLNRADSFTAISVGVFIGGLTDAGVATTAGAYQLFGYQAPALTTAGVTNSTALFCQGYLNVLVNNVAYLQNYDLLQCYAPPLAQTGNLFATGTSTTYQNNIDGSHNGFADLVPTLQFSGTSKIDITLNLPTSLAVTNACQINLIFRGFLSLGASNLNR
jgi:hypothetical protein